MSDVQETVTDGGWTDFSWVCRVLAGPSLAMYGACRWYQGLSGVRGPGVIWTVGHTLLWFSQLALTVVLVTDVLAGRGSHESGWRHTGVKLVATASLFGGLTSLAQTTLDLAAGIMADDRASMNWLYTRMSTCWWTSFLTHHAAAALLPISTLLWALTTQQVHSRGRRTVCGALATAFVATLSHPNLLPLSGCLLTGLLVRGVPIDSRDKSSHK